MKNLPTLWAGEPPKIFLTASRCHEISVSSRGQWRHQFVTSIMLLELRKFLEFISISKLENSAEWWWRKDLKNMWERDRKRHTKIETETAIEREREKKKLRRRKVLESDSIYFETCYLSLYEFCKYECRLHVQY